ncbi:MAG: hypothetical protein RL220_1905 [Bacteroidota bacterium]
MRLIAVISTFLVLCYSASGQSYKFQFFREQEGIKDRFIYSIAQDQYGRLIVGTGEGLYLFDGKKFEMKTTEHGLSQNFITCSYTASADSLWLGHNDGSITLFSNGTFTPQRLEAITKARINAITELKNGHVLVLSQNDGIIIIGNNNQPVHIPNEDDSYTYYSVCVTGNTIWLGTDIGLLRGEISSNGTFTGTLTEGIPVTRISAITISSNGQLIIGTEDAGIYNLNPSDGQALAQPVYADEIDLGTMMINQITEDSDNSLWISTNNAGLVQLSEFSGGSYHKVTDFNEEDLLGTQSVQTSFRDREKNTWIGTKGKGLAKIQDDYFSEYRSETADSSAVYSLSYMGENLLHGKNGVISISSFNPNQVHTKLGAKQGIPADIISSIHTAQDGSIWFGTAGSGLWQIPAGSNMAKRFPLAEDKLNQKVNQIIGDGSGVMVATDFGIYIIRNNAIEQHLSIQSGLPHNVVRALFTDTQNRTWIGTSSKEIGYLQAGKLHTFSIPGLEGTLDLRCFAEDRQNNIWCGTNGSGIIRISADMSTSVIDRTVGLYSDYCHSIVCGHQNRIWVGHRGALSRIHPENNQCTIFHPSSYGETDFLELSAIAIPDGTILFGTQNGILRYDHLKDTPNTIEPVLSFTSVIISDSTYAVADKISLGSGVYKVEFSFIGISLRKPEEVTYQYFLEGYDLDWSEPVQDGKVIYSRLDAGDYVFKVKVFNSDGYGGTLIKEIRLSIARPFWQEAWFVLLCLAFIAGTTVFFVRRREKFLKANQEYLKRELDVRTKEVVEQKELVELRNRDITASIQYAKNIQKAILPEPEDLNHYFKESFVYHKPCEIVSGDFYWMDHSGENVLVACADCTGHGVPGAFMSLIGNTLMTEVKQLKDVRSPGQFLKHLDTRMKNLLSRKAGVFSVEDGMDVSFLEYNTRTRVLRVSSANRPVFIFTAGELTELRGDRSPIGGSLLRSTEDFTEKEIQLNEGDCIYMFSDGLTDQFGGPLGKKLKKKGLMEWLKSCKHMSMDEQRSFLRNKFNDWKGDLDQIDDVMIIGLRV